MNTRDTLVNPARIRAWQRSTLSPSVSIDSMRIKEVAESVTAEMLTLPKFSNPEVFWPRSDPEELLGYFLAYNAINYCFFSELPPYSIYTSANYQGSMLAAYKLRLWWEYLSRPCEMAKVSASFVDRVLFASGGTLALLSERTYALRELGHFLDSLRQRGESLLATFKDECEGDALLIAQYLSEALPSWEDPYLKRAQLFPSMIYCRFLHEGIEVVKQESLSQLTVLADYRLPQALIEMRILVPDQQLLTHLKDQRALPVDSEYEDALRATSIVAADLLMKAIRDRLSWVTPLHVDGLLWRIGSKRQANPWVAGPRVPHHVTLTTRY